jgi:hypothetical protein
MGTTVGEGGGEIVLGQLFLDRLGKRTCVIAIKTFYPHIFANIYGFVIQNLTEYIHCTSKLFITIHKILKPGTLVLFLLIYIKNPPSQYSLYQTITIDFRLY